MFGEKRQIIELALLQIRQCINMLERIRTSPSAELSTYTAGRLEFLQARLEHIYSDVEKL